MDETQHSEPAITKPTTLHVISPIPKGWMPRKAKRKTLEEEQSDKTRQEQLERERIQAEKAREELRTRQELEKRELEEAAAKQQAVEARRRAEVVEEQKIREKRQKAAQAKLEAEKAEKEKAQRLRELHEKIAKEQLEKVQKDNAPLMRPPPRPPKKRIDRAACRVSDRVGQLPRRDRSRWQG